MLHYLDLPGEVKIALHMAIILVVILIVGKVGVRLIDGLMRPERLPGSWDERRIDTVRGLANSLLKYGLYFIGGVMLLDELGVPTTSILAGAGILGLAVGFGAQSLVKDVITGFFILFEDQFAVGDYVTVSGATGTVLEMGLRVTRVQIWTGEIHIIPNGNIEKVINYSRSGMGVFLEVDVAYEVDLDHAMEIINKVCQQMTEERVQQVVEMPGVLGVSKLSSAGVTIQVFGKVNPMEQWAFARELRKRIKEAFEREGIEIPYPHCVIMKKQREEIGDDTEDL